MQKRVFARHWTQGCRGPFSDVLIQDEDGGLYPGVVFYDEVAREDITDISQAQRFCEANIDLILAGFRNPNDVSMMAGWSPRHLKQRAMIEDACDEAGWSNNNHALRQELRSAKEKIRRLELSLAQYEDAT